MHLETEFESEKRKIAGSRYDRFAVHHESSRLKCLTVSVSANEAASFHSSKRQLSRIMR